MARLGQRLGLTRYDADQHYKLALQAYEKRKLDDAIIEMDKAIELLPNSPEYHAAKGFFYLEDGIDDKAIPSFEQALQIYPYEILAHYGLGVLANKKKKWEEALNHFNLAYRADPNRPESAYYLALTHHHMGNNPIAAHYMAQAEKYFDQKNDKRQSDAGKWVKTLQDLAEEQMKQQQLNAPQPPPSQLPSGD